jgi:hypothetical protein
MCLIMTLSNIEFLNFAFNWSCKGIPRAGTPNIEKEKGVKKSVKKREMESS